MFERFKAGETLHVRASSGREFYIEPVFWEGFLLGYSILDEDMQVVPGYRRKMKEHAELRIWFGDLEEIA